MNDIYIQIKNKIAVGDNSEIVNDNRVYTAHFTFDEEWDNYSTKTALFIDDKNNRFEVLFSGDTCEVPKLNNTSYVKVGVIAGDTLATTPTYFNCSGAITDGNPIHIDPPQDVYNQLTEKLNELELEVDDKLDEAPQDDKTYGRKNGEWREITGGGSGTSDHSELENLDYKHSGHTGFASSQDIEELDNSKQDNIEDLSEIRSGAEAGATAVQDDNYVHTDNNYTTAEKTKLAGLSNYDDSEIRAELENKADSEDIPTATSQLNNNSGFITNAVDNLTNYYLKSETYTKAEVGNLISAIQKVTIEIVSALPATGDSNKIYFVPKTGSTDDVYDEYIYLNSTWEKIGSTDVDLTNYYTKAEADTLLNNKQNTLIAGTGISIVNNVISVDLETWQGGSY